MVSDRFFRQEHGIEKVCSRQHILHGVIIRLNERLSGLSVSVSCPVVPIDVHEGAA